MNCYRLLMPNKLCLNKRTSKRSFWFLVQEGGLESTSEEWEVQSEVSQAGMREDTELLSNTLREVAKAVLKDTDDTEKIVGVKTKGKCDINIIQDMMNYEP